MDSGAPLGLCWGMAQTILITGTDHGLGAALARLLADRGRHRVRRRPGRTVHRNRGFGRRPPPDSPRHRLGRQRRPGRRRGRPADRPPRRRGEQRSLAGRHRGHPLRRRRLRPDAQGLQRQRPGEPEGHPGVPAAAVGGPDAPGGERVVGSGVHRRQHPVGLVRLRHVEGGAEHGIDAGAQPASGPGRQGACRPPGARAHVHAGCGRHDGNPESRRGGAPAVEQRRKTPQGSGPRILGPEGEVLPW